MKELRIYYADDDPEDQELFQEVILEEKLVCQLHLQKDGKELMDQLNQTAELPDVLFLDLNIPKKNGIQVLKEIRSSQKLQSLRVIVVTTSNDFKTIQVVRELGADFYISKPESYADFRRAILFGIGINWDSFVPDDSQFVYKGN